MLRKVHHRKILPRNPHHCIISLKPQIHSWAENFIQAHYELHLLLQAPIKVFPSFFLFSLHLFEINTNTKIPFINEKSSNCFHSVLYQPVHSPIHPSIHPSMHLTLIIRPLALHSFINIYYSACKLTFIFLNSGTSYVFRFFKLALPPSLSWCLPLLVPSPPYAFTSKSPNSITGHLLLCLWTHTNFYALNLLPTSLCQRNTYPSCRCFCSW